MGTTKDGIHVLHVDDEPDLTQLVAEFLEREDDRLTVDTATSVSEGLDRVAEEHFDCVVSDYAMPGQNGIEFLETLREEHSDLPFILYTGKGSEEVASDALSAGATDYLQKRTGTEQYELLANRILNAVDQYRARRRATELERIRTLVNDVNQALIRANARAELETRVCEIISDSDPYRFAWIGETDPESGRVVPRTWGGVEDGYLDEITLRTDESATGRGPTGTAIRERRVAVSQHVAEDPAFTYTEAALDRGFRAMAAVPLEYEDTLYGGLNVYADRPDAFNADEQAVLAELGEDIGHAIHAEEVKTDLVRARQRAEQYFETAGTVMVVLDRDGTVTRINERGCDLLGYERSELIGSDWLGHVAPSDSAAAIDEILDSFWEDDADPVFENTNPIETKDGEPIVVKWHNTALQEQDGTVAAVLCSGIDITERQRNEAELERKQAFLEQTQRVANVGGWEIDLATESLRWTDEVYRIFGLDEEFEPSLEATIDRFHPEDQASIRDAVERAMAAGEPYDQESRIVTAEDQVRWVHARGEPRDEDGDIVGMRGTLQDITERKERERALEASERRYKSLFESNPAVVWVEDFSAANDYIEELQGTVEDVQAYLESNPEEIHRLLELTEIRDVSDQALDRYGAPSKAALLENMEAILTQTGYEANAEIWHRLSQGETHFRVQTVAETFDGERIDELIDVRVPEASTDDFSRVYLTAIDITERKRNEEQLEAQRNQLEVLNQVLRHDIRNDLQLVMAYADRLEAELDGEPDHVGPIQENARHAVELTNTVRDMADVWLSEANDPAEMALQSTLETVVEETRSVHPDSVIEVEGTIPDVPVLADEMLPSMFDNLLSNAIHHSDKEVPSVTVAVDAGEETVQIRVADNGPGVPDDRKEAIFGKGEKGIESSRTGLGLYLVKTLADKYDGAVWVEDNDPEGAVFVVELRRPT